jgi:hypothetical protein
VLDISTENRRTNAIEDILKIWKAEIDKKIRLRIRKINVSFKALIESVSNSLNLNLEKESNTIITKARIAIDASKTLDEIKVEYPNLFIIIPTINNINIFGIFK